MDKKNIFAQFSQIRNPLLVLVVTFLITAFTTFYMYGRIMFLRREIKSTQDQNKIFGDRVATLQIIRPDIESDVAKVALISLPSQNPSLFVISQINTFLNEYSLSLTRLDLNLLTNPNPEETLFEVSISFNVEGSYQNISDFITKLGDITPLVNLRQADISNSSESAEAIIELSSFWSPFPTELPPLTTSLAGLTDEEKETLKSLSNFVSPTFDESLSPRRYDPRANPFNLDNNFNPEEAL